MTDVFSKTVCSKMDLSKSDRFLSKKFNCSAVSLMCSLSFHLLRYNPALLACVCVSLIGAGVVPITDRRALAVLYFWANFVRVSSDVKTLDAMVLFYVPVITL